MRAPPESKFCSIPLPKPTVFTNSLARVSTPALVPLLCVISSHEAPLGSPDDLTTFELSGRSSADLGAVVVSAILTPTPSVDAAN